MESPIRRAAPTWLVCSLLAFSVLAVFGQTLGFGFISYDDPEAVVTNPWVERGLGWEGLRWAFTTFFFANWIPLSWLSLMLDAEIAGLDPRMFHLTNLLLHTASTLLLFRLLDRASRDRWKSAWVAALFALHPLHVESVAWVAERKDVLSTLFWFLTMLLWLRWTERPGALRYAAVLLSFGLGLLSKPMLVTLPCVLLLFDYWPLGRRRERTLLQLVREKLPLLALAAASSATTVIAQRAGGALGSLDAYPLAARLANAVLSYALYLKQTLWPIGLAVFYPHPGSELPLASWLGAALFLAAVSVGIAILGRSRPYLIVGWLWYLGTLVPVIGIIQVGYQARADRYTYLPLVGIFILLAWGVPPLFGRRQRSAGAVAIASLAAAGWLAFLQCGYWRASIPLFERAIQVTAENAIAQHNLASAYYQRNQPGDRERSLVHYSEAIRIDPDYTGALNSLAGVLLELGRTQEAIDRWSELVRIKPHATAALCNLCGVLTRAGRLAEADQRCSQALRSNPQAACARYNLGHLRLQQSRILDAESEFEAALRIAPLDADARISLGVVLERQGRFEPAIAQYLEVLRLDPSNPLARANLDRIRRQRAAD
ncbi:MAG TPA: tetratricopeptide repeat protein [Myxococcota bacterium]